MLESLNIFLPIAGINANVAALLLIGLVTGVLTGIFGIGGGLVSVPYLMFYGIPSHVAVASAANQMTAGTLSSYLAYARKGLVDYRISSLLIIGGLLGTGIGAYIFEMIMATGDGEVIISLIFFVLLTCIAINSLREGLKFIIHKMNGKEHAHFKPWKLFTHLPFQENFKSTDHPTSALMPFVIGSIGGFFVALIGVGGGFIMIPALIYLIGQKDGYITGTAQFQMVFTSVFATLLHGFTTQSLDIILCFILIIGTALGAQIGARIGKRLSPSIYRFLLSILLLTMCSKFAYNLLSMPNDLYSITTIMGAR